MEKIYIGTKIIAAEPMDELAFSFVKPIDRVIPVDSEGKGQPGYKVRYEDGYVSWSPKETFERAYREVTDREMILLLYREGSDVK